MGFTLLIAQVSAIGKNEAASTALAFNVNAVAFVPLIGLGIAVSTLVGQKLGENRPNLAGRATWTAIVLAMIYTGLFAVPLVATPDIFLALHAAEANPSEFAPIRALTVQLFHFIILYCFFDALQIIFVGALKGAGDTGFILLTSLVASFAGILAGKFSAWFIWPASCKAAGG
jgi:MATE family multidrug resistance protein